MEGQINSGTMWQCCRADDKASVLYGAKNPEGLKNKNKMYLPVFWQHNQTAWVPDILFMEWFQQCITRRKVSTV